MVFLSTFHWPQSILVAHHAIALALALALLSVLATTVRLILSGTHNQWISGSCDTLWPPSQVCLTFFFTKHGVGLQYGFALSPLSNLRPAL